MKKYPEELKRKVVAALYELDNSKPAIAGEIARIAREHSVNANVVYQWRPERKGRVAKSSDSTNKIKAVTETSSLNEHELGLWLRSN